MHKKIKDFYENEVLSDENKTDGLSPFLKDNDIYLHFTKSENLESILRDGLSNDINKTNNFRRAVYGTKESRGYYRPENDLCLVVDFSGLLTEHEKDDKWDYVKDNYGLVEVWYKGIVPPERIIAFWKKDKEGIHFNDKYSLRSEFKEK